MQLLPNLEQLLALLLSYRQHIFSILSKCYFQYLIFAILQVFEQLGSSPNDSFDNVLTLISQGLLLVSPIDNVFSIKYQVFFETGHSYDQ